MKKLERLGETRAPDGTTLTLYRHDGEYRIMIGAVELMSTRRHHSETVLAELACEPLRDISGARVLIGGLGLGFTLQAALRVLAPDARVVVAELVAGVIEWNRNAEYALAAEALADERVELRVADVADVLRESPAAFDAIILDVDNGPDALTSSGNALLYRASGVKRAAAALRTGGTLAYWSDHDDAAFEHVLRQAKLSATPTHVRAHVTAGPWHTLYLARAT